MHLAATVLLTYLCIATWTVSVAVVTTLHHLDATADSLAAAPLMLSAQIGGMQAALTAMPAQVLPPVLASVDAAVSDADTRIKQVADLGDTRTAEAMRAVDRLLAMVDRRSGEALATVGTVSVAALPVLSATATLLTNANDSLNDSYDDVRGLLDSSTVAATQTAQTMQAVREHAPQLTADISGIAMDFHDATHSLDERFFHPPPRTRWQKVKAALMFIPLAALAALRGGVLVL